MSTERPEFDQRVTACHLALHEHRSSDADSLAAQIIDDPTTAPAAFALLANEARRQDRAELAVRLAEAGLARDAGSTTLQRQLGLALAAAKRFSESESALAQALEGIPDDLLAQLARGQVLARLGRQEDSLSAYFRAVELTGRAGFDWDKMPEDMRAGLQIAHSAVANARATAVMEALATVRNRYGPGSIRRVHQAMQNYFSGSPPVPPHPLQRPTFLFVPGLSDRAWFERSELPFLSLVEEATDVIRQELSDVLADPGQLKPYVEMSEHAPAAPVWKELNRSPLWSSFHLLRHGQRVEENCRRCPRTIALLEQLPLHRVPEHGPEAMFSVLQPRTRIPPHTGVVNGRLTVHLPLIVPADCGALRAGGEARAWHEGECLIFDDSFVHEAWNDSDRIRVVLIFDIWNPELGEAEREAMAAAIAAIGRVNRRYGAPDPMMEAH